MGAWASRADYQEHKPEHKKYDFEQSSWPGSPSVKTRPSPNKRVGFRV